MKEQLKMLNAYNNELTNENQKISKEKLEMDKKFNKMAIEL